MSAIQFSPRAYTKMILHASKYPHLAVNGVLLASKEKSGKGLQIVDTIPLFHQCLYVTPMAEVALVQVGYRIIGCPIRMESYNIGMKLFWSRLMLQPQPKVYMLLAIMWLQRTLTTTALSELLAIRLPTRLPSMCLMPVS